jgi:hypothetical protein
MNKIKILLIAVVALTTFTQCDTAPKKILEKADTRGKMISALMSNDVYMKEVMDSMQVKHGGNMSGMHMGSGDMKMDENMMNKMMEMCKTDSAMCKMMMDKTMSMANADSSMCKMMMTSMKAHPNLMKPMEGMKDMKMNKK